jgi:hypothetical protein
MELVHLPYGFGSDGFQVTGKDVGKGKTVIHWQQAQLNFIVSLA